MNAPSPLPGVAPAWRGVRRVLAVRLDNLGDLLMTTPALAAIRLSLPNASLSLLASPSGVQAARHIAEIDDAIAFNAPWVKSQTAAIGQEYRSVLRTAQQLATREFDAAVIFTVCTQSALPAAMLCMLAGIPLRLAYSRENPYALLSDWVPETDALVDGMRHEVERQLALVGHVGMRAADETLRFAYSADDGVRMRRQMLAAGGDPGGEYFVIHPGASAPSRRYPPEQFGVAARLIVERTGLQAVFAGGVDELEMINAARRAMGGAPSVSLAGALSLGELGALIGCARLLVSNNSGPAHMAAALGTPVVNLYALTNPQHTPWQVASRVLNHDVACRNCLKSTCPEGHHECLRRVTPEQVAAAALELLAGAQTRPPEFDAGSPAHSPRLTEAQ